MPNDTSGDYSQQQWRPEHTISHLPLRILIVLLVILLGVIAIWIYLSPMLPSAQQTTAKVTFPGLLIMSIEAQPLSGVASSIIPVQYDSALHDFLTPPISKLSTSVQGGTMAYQHRLSDSETWITFLGAVGLNGKNASTTPLQVYRANIADATYQTITSKIQAAKAITSDSMVKQLPAISDTGDVVYMARSSTTPGNDANSWGIYLIPAAGGQPQFLANGVSPQWIDSDTVLYVADDGLRAFHIKGRYADKIWGVTTAASAETTMSVSRDKRLIAISFPDTATTYVLRSLDGTLNTLTLRGSISASASYPAISPDDATLALQTAVPAGDGVGLAIQFYDLETLQQIPSATIDMGQVFPVIQASAVAHAAAPAQTSSSTKVAAAGLISTESPLAVVLTDWIP